MTTARVLLHEADNRSRGKVVERARGGEGRAAIRAGPPGLLELGDWREGRRRRARSVREPGGGVGPGHGP